MQARKAGVAGLAGVRRGRGLAGATLLAALLGGCTVGPDFVQPVSPVTDAQFWPGHGPAPSGGSQPGASQPGASQPGGSQPGASQPGASQPVPAPADPAWWRSFNDAELSSLEQRLAGANLDVAAALARLAQSRAQFSEARAAALPSVQADGSYTRELPSKKGVLSLFSGGTGTSYGSNGGLASGAAGTVGAFPNAFGVNPFDLWQYGFDASWELDLWGRVRRSEESARASATQSAELARSALVSAEAELARDYINLRGTERQITIVEDDIRTFQHTRELTRQRAAAGLSTELDVANAEAELAAAEAEIPSLSARATELRNAIALLMGAAPGSLDATLASTGRIPPVPPVVPVGLASDLVRRRPDIRAAEAGLHAATANIGVAVADFFPQISLTGSFGFQSLQLSQIGQWAAQQYGVGPTITLPIFQGGRLHAVLRLRHAEAREAAITYRKTVLAAFGDVSNALADYAAEQTRRTRLEAGLTADRRAFMLATQQYRQGLTSFIEVLDAERSELQAEQDLAGSTTSVGTDLVSLYKALGGGWQEARPEAVASRS